MNKKILVLAGTKDGREIIENFWGKKYDITASVATELGKSYLNSYEGLKIHQGRMNQKELADYISEQQFDVIVDVSHPYALELSKNAMAACKQTGTIYVRYERKRTNCKGLHFSDYEQTVSYLNQTSGKILLTTGTNRLEEFLKIKNWKFRIVVRVLNQKESIEKCLALGFDSDQIICENGPFSIEENLQHIQKYKIEILVTKDGGVAGGMEEKGKAAEKAGISFVIIDRPFCHYENEFQDLQRMMNWIEGEGI